MKCTAAYLLCHDNLMMIEMQCDRFSTCTCQCMWCGKQADVFICCARLGRSKVISVAAECVKASLQNVKTCLAQSNASRKLTCGRPVRLSAGLARAATC